MTGMSGRRPIHGRPDHGTRTSGTVVGLTACITMVSFGGDMPDLNYDNPDVSTEMMNVSKFWLEEVGVDGFRVDAARYLFADGTVQQDTAEPIQWFEDWRTFYKAIDPEAFTVGEVWTDLQVTAKYGQGMDSLLMFDLAEDIKNSIFTPQVSRITESYLETLEYFPDHNFSSFSPTMTSSG